MKSFKSCHTFLMIMILSIPQISSCKPPGSAPGPEPPAAMSGRQHPSGQGVSFALSLYRHMGEKDANRVLSPLSISTALAMVYEGARGDTAKEMAQALWPQKGERASFSRENHRSMLQEISDMNRADGITLLMASRIWPQKGYPLLPVYLESLTKYHLSEISPIDFTAKTIAAKTINAWVKKKTARQISHLIAPEMLKPSTRMVLTNAVYFKGEWAMPFDPAQTRTEPFITAEGKKVAVFMMNRAGRFNFMENEALQALEIPYAGNAVSMILLLPKDRNTLSALEAELSQEMIQTLFAQMESRSVRVCMPRFQIGSSFDLSQTLTSLGMVAAFSRHADFSGMDGAQNLFLSAVLHKARIEVNEKGAEAAAATAVIVFEKTAFDRTPVFRADHPFLFMIRENKRGELLFLGRVMDPNGEQPL